LQKFSSTASQRLAKKEDDEEEEKTDKVEPNTATAVATPGFAFGGGGGLFGGAGGQGQDTSQALTSLQQEGFTTKPFANENVIPAVLSANNPDLKISPQGGLFGHPQPVAKVAQKKEKTEKKTKPSVFNAPKAAKSLEKTKPIQEVEEEKKEEEEENLEAKSPSLPTGGLFGSPFNPVALPPAIKTKTTKKSKTNQKSKNAQKKDEEEEPVKEDKDEEALQNEKLARDIVSTFEFVKKELSFFHVSDDSKASIEEALKLPLREGYRALLKPLIFDYMNMKASDGQYQHHYKSYLGLNSIPPQAKMIRLAQELADLSNSLPYEHTNAIFIRVDKSKVDLMKVMIMGSSQTPYAHGAFEFDVFFEDTYPNGPPKINLCTTGGGNVRFNPNLYNNGKVCLSLLGTWQGRGGENWDPKLSTFLQVLLSIQSLIMTEDIYYNEPGLEVHAGTLQGEMENEGYSNVVRYCNIKYAMIEQIRNPPKGFETVVRRHFYLKKKEILDEAKQWIELAKTKDASYTGCQNYNWQNVFNQSKTKYQDMLVEIIKELEEELNKLPVPTDLEQESKTETKRSRKPKAKVEEKEKPLEEIDVTYDKDVKAKELDITDDAVKDRWSRYIGAMGIEAVMKQANSSVFLSGLGPLGVEIAKNITLSGVKRLTLHDSKKSCSQ